jgi:hypothetical protein
VKLSPWASRLKSPFYGTSILAVKLSDGRVAAVFSLLCAALDLARQPQVRRVRADDVIAESLIPVRIETPGGPQEVEALVAWAIPVWLQGIKVSRLAPEKQPAILAFRREAADVLYQHFAARQRGETVAPPEPTALVPSEPITKPEFPGPTASEDELIDYHEQMLAFLYWRKDVEAWRAHIDLRQDQLEDRVESLEAGIQLLPEILERLGSQTLTAEHQALVKGAVKELHDLAGFSFGAIYFDLNQHFHVGTVTDIPESRWQEVAEWFRMRLEAARRHPREP